MSQEFTTPTPQESRRYGVRMLSLVTAGAITFAACSSDEASNPNVPLPGSSETTLLGTETTTTAEVTEGMTDAQKQATEELIAAGYDPEFAAESVLTVSLTGLVDPSECIARVADAKGGEDNAFAANYLVKDTNGKVLINTNMFSTAGEGLIINGGPNHFTTSVANDFQEGIQQTPQEVAAYFDDRNAVIKRNEEARLESYARLCGDKYQLSTAMVTVANAHFGNTNVTMADLSPEIFGEFKVENRTPEEMTAAVERAIAKYTIEYPVGVDTAEERRAYVEGLSIEEQAKLIAAYEAQLLDAARLISILETLAPVLNQETVEVNSSFVHLPALTEAGYPKLAFSNQDIFGVDDGALDGKYSAMAGSVIKLGMVGKGGCIPLDGVIVNTLDGRYGYAIVEIEGCEPIVVVTTTTNETGTTTPNTIYIPPKSDSGITPGGGNKGTPGVAGNGPAGQTVDPNGKGNGDVTAIPDQPLETSPSTTLAAGGVEGTAPSSTNAPVVVDTAPSTTLQTGTRPKQP